MLVQVPLKYREPPRRAAPWFGGMPMAKAAPQTAERSRDSDMEVAVLGHGALEGPYTELDGLDVERDPRFPVRVTVQFYQAISDANVGPANLEKLASQISRVYRSGDYVGSLVLPNPADLRRPTNWDGVSEAPAGVALAPLLRSLEAAIGSQWERALGEDPEGLHDFRVAVRRLRTWLRFLRGELLADAARYRSMACKSRVCEREAR